MRIALGSDHRGGKIAAAILTEILFPENDSGFIELKNAGCSVGEGEKEFSLVGAFMITGEMKPEFVGDHLENLLPEIQGDPSMTKQVDYPDIAMAVAERVSSGEADLGILVCATGIGMCIVANKFFGIRAAACYSEVAAELSRQHNNANILCIPGEIVGVPAAVALVRKWLATPYEGGRHQYRINKIKAIEEKTGL